MSDKSFDKINDEDLEGVNGGYIFNTRELCRNPKIERRWEVIDGQGNVIGTESSKNMAEETARARGESDRQLSWDQLQKLRGTGSPD